MGFVDYPYRLIIQAWENPIQTALVWANDTIALVTGTGQLSQVDYEGIRDELVAGMRRAGATEEQIQAALREYQGIVDAKTSAGAEGGTPLSNPPLTFADLSGSLFWLLAIGVTVAIIGEYAIRYLERR